VTLTREQIDAWGTTRGGYLADIPAPHLRRWPADARARRVTVDITSWIGVSIGARHYYCRVVEEDNPIWNPVLETVGADAGKPHGWTYPWDDKEGKGQSFRNNKLFSEHAAIVWAKGVIATHFAGTRYAVEWPDHLERRALPRDGD